MDMEVFFPGNQKVFARYKGFVVETDQPVSAGGEGIAPAPVDLFYLSIGTCAGFYVLSFLQQRGIATDNAGIVLRQERDPDSKLARKITIEIKLPADFPEKYRDAIVRAVMGCTVKRQIESPPEFEAYATIG
jgi:putative redox protein